MKQLFKTRYTKDDPNIKSWAGVLPDGRVDVFVAFPEDMNSPFEGRDTTSMDYLARTRFGVQLRVSRYGYYDIPEDLFFRSRFPNTFYEEVIF